MYNNYPFYDFENYMRTNHDYTITDIRLAIKDDNLDQLLWLLEKKPALKEQALSCLIELKKDEKMINGLLAKYPEIKVTDEIKYYLVKCGAEKNNLETIRQLLSLPSNTTDFRKRVMYYLAIQYKDAWIPKLLDNYPEMAVAYLFDTKLTNELRDMANGSFFIEVVAKYKLWMSLEKILTIINDHPQLKFPKRDPAFLNHYTYNCSYDYGGIIPLHPLTQALIEAVNNNHSTMVRRLLEAKAPIPIKKIYGVRNVECLLARALEHKNENMVCDLFLFGLPRDSKYENNDVFKQGWKLYITAQRRREMYSLLAMMMHACAYKTGPLGLLSAELICLIFNAMDPDYQATSAVFNKQLTQLTLGRNVKGVNNLLSDPVRVFCKLDPLLKILSDIEREKTDLSAKQISINKKIAEFLITLPVDNLLTSREVTLLDKHGLINNDHQNLIQRRQNWLVTLFDLSNVHASEKTTETGKSEILEEIHSYKGKIALNVSLLKQIKNLYNSIGGNPAEKNQVISQFLNKLLIQEKTWESTFFWSLWTDNLDKDLIHAAITLIPNIEVRGQCLLIALRGLETNNQGHLYDVCHVKRWKPGMFMESTLKKIENDYIKTQQLTSALNDKSVIEELCEESCSTDNTNK